ncbi:hypothetical protein BRADI_2g24385v3, partial [Brachypodium distachyon]
HRGGSRAYPSGQGGERGRRRCSGDRREEGGLRIRGDEGGGGGERRSCGGNGKAAGPGEMMGGRRGDRRWGGIGAAGVGEEAGRPAFRRRRAAGVGEESGRPNVGTNGRRWGGGGAAGGWDEAAWGRSGGGKGARCVSAREGSLGSGEKRFASGNLAVALAVNMVCRG